MVKFEDFLHKKIEICFISEDQTSMYWRVSGVWYEILAIGDCCSTSWFESCDDAEALKDAYLQDFEDVYMGSKEGSTEDIVIRVNTLKFTTNKGRVTIDFRNQSNGYYSGWAEISKIDMVEPTEKKGYYVVHKLYGNQENIYLSDLKSNLAKLF